MTARNAILAHPVLRAHSPSLWAAGDLKEADGAALQVLRGVDGLDDLGVSGGKTRMELLKGRAGHTSQREMSLDDRHGGGGGGGSSRSSSASNARTQAALPWRWLCV